MFKRVTLTAAILFSLNTNAQTCSQLFATQSTKNSPAKKSETVIPKDTAVNVWTLENGQYPDFSKIKVSDLMPSLEMSINEIQSTISKIKTIQNPTFENTIEPLEFSDIKLKRFNGLYGTLSSSFSTEKFKKVEDSIINKLQQFDTQMWMDQELFEKIEIIYKNRENLDPDQKRLVEKYREGFVRSGLNLRGEKRKRFIKIKEELALLENQFRKNTVESKSEFKLLIKDKSELFGLSDELIEKLEANAKSEKKEGYLFLLEPSVYTSAMETLENRDLRKKLMFAWGTVAYNTGKTDNSNVVKRIATLRHELAQLLGYQNYSAYVLENVMAKNAKAVEDLNSQIIQFYKPYALREEQELRNFVKLKTGKDDLEAWDRPYWVSKLLKENYAFDENLVKEYLNYNNVQQAIFHLAEKLYGLKFIARKDLPRLHKDIQVFEVRDRNNELLSYLTMDPFVRLGSKSQGAWMSDLFPTYKENGKRAIPIITTTTNFSKPASNVPLLLRVDEAVTMFHEFGHALHGMLSQARYPTQSGTNVARDFVELPSQFMENFFYEKEVLKTFARHYKTNEVIPDNYIDAIIKLKQFRSATAALGQVGLGMIDFAWHNGSAIKMPGSIFETEQSIIAPTIISPNTLGTVKSTAFTHIFSGGYSSGYYSYKWAEILDADAFSVFKKEGLFNPETANRFLKTILENGGSKDPMELYIEFAGRKPTIDAMLKRDGIKKP